MAATECFGERGTSLHVWSVRHLGRVSLRVPLRPSGKAKLNLLTFARVERISLRFMGIFRRLPTESKRPPCAYCGSPTQTLDVLYGLDRGARGDVQLLPGIIAYLKEIKKVLPYRLVERFGFTGLCERCAIKTVTEILTELNIVCHYCGELHDLASLTNKNPIYPQGTLFNQIFWKTRTGFYDLQSCERPRSTSYMRWIEHQETMAIERSAASQPNRQSHNRSERAVQQYYEYDSSEHPFQQYAEDNGMSLSDFMDSLGD